MQNMMQTEGFAPVFNNSYQHSQRVVALGQRVLQSDSVGPELRVEAVMANARQQKVLKVQKTEPVSQGCNTLCLLQSLCSRQLTSDAGCRGAVLASGTTTCWKPVTGTGVFGVDRRRHVQRIGHEL